MPHAPAAAGAAIRVLGADWGEAADWGGGKRCDVARAVEARCALRRRCTVPLAPSLCPEPPRPLVGLGRRLSVTFRCAETGRARTASADMPGTLLLRCDR